MKRVSTGEVHQAKSFDKPQRLMQFTGAIISGMEKPPVPAWVISTRIKGLRV